VVPTAAETFVIGGGTYTETWTWIAARAQPYQVTIGSTAAESIDNAVAAVNADTVQNIIADNVSDTHLRIRSAAYPGGTLEFGVRDWAGNVETMVAGGNGPWATTSAGAGNVAGAPSWSVLARTSDYVKIRVRGLESTDSLTYRVRAWRMHSMIRTATSQLVTGTDGECVVGANTFTPASSPTFVTNGVAIGDILVINEPDSGGVGDTVNNGSYEITAVSETSVTVSTTDLPNGWRATQSNVDFAVGYGSALSVTEAGIAQAPFGLPGDDIHSAADPCTDVDIPGASIETGELADGALAASAAGRAKMAVDYFGAGVAASVAHFADDFWTTGALAKFADGTFTPVKLTIQPVHHIGRRAVGWVRFIGGAGSNVADTVTIDGNVNTAAAVADHANRVYDQSSGTDAGCAAAFAAMVNDVAYPDDVEALVMPAGGDCVCLVNTGDFTNPTFAESTGSARTIISAANFVGGTAAADRSIVSGQYIITAADVTCLDPVIENQQIPIANIPSTAAPRLVSLEIRDANGVFRSKATVGATLEQVNANEYVLRLDETGGVGVLVATDTVNFQVEVTG